MEGHDVGVLSGVGACQRERECMSFVSWVTLTLATLWDAHYLTTNSRAVAEAWAWLRALRSHISRAREVGVCVPAHPEGVAGAALSMLTMRSMLAETSERRVSRR